MQHVSFGNSTPPSAELAVFGKPSGTDAGGATVALLSRVAGFRTTSFER